MKKILLVGPEVTDFLNPLARRLKNSGYTVDLLETRKNPRINKHISDSYSNILNFNELTGKHAAAADIIKYLFTVEFYKNFINTIYFNYQEGNCKIFKSFRNSFAAQHLKKVFSPIYNNYDIINFHSLSPGTLSYTKPINADKKIILSFWGSDLYQMSGLRNYYEQHEALHRANVITVMNYEMELMVLAKFGSELKNKIVHKLFGLNEKVMDKIDDFGKRSPDLNYLQKYNIPENKIKITIGYCGNPICNHLLILEELNKINKSIKEKVHLLVPMTYGNYSNEYMESVKLKLNQTEICYSLFDTFLSFEDMVKLRLASDIMIQMSKSDAFSASVCEYIYANNILISAIWLPYSRFRYEGVFFYETDFKQLNERITSAINNFDQIKAKTADNTVKIKQLFNPDKTLEQWIDLINSLS